MDESVRKRAADMGLRTRDTVPDGIRYDSGWVRDTCMIEYQPGNGTRYVLAFQKVPFADASSDCGVEMLERAGLPLRVAIVSWLYEGKCMTVTLDDRVLHWTYVREKLRVDVPTAVVLAELFAFVLGRTAMSCEEWAANEENRGTHV